MGEYASGEGAFLDLSSGLPTAGEGAAVEAQSIGVVSQEDPAVEGAGESDVLLLQTFRIPAWFFDP